MFRATVENLVDAPLHYHRVGDDHETCCLHERFARRAWRELQTSRPECRTATRDFADGFKAGFVDHLTYGGPPLPPVVPHRR